MFKTRFISMLVLLAAVATGAVAQSYNVTVKDGTEDADKWSATPNPATAGQTVTIKYNGTKTVKSIKAVKKVPTLATALENDATVKVDYIWNGDNHTYFNFTNNNGTYTCSISGDPYGNFHGSLTKSGNTLVFAATNTFMPNEIDVTINFDTTNNKYQITKSGSFYGGFAISVNGTDITSQLTAQATDEEVAVTKTANNNEWTLTMPASDVELEVEYYHEVTLTDGEGITALNTCVDQEKWVHYTRSFTSGKTSTVCLPFAYTKKAGDGSFYAFTDIKKENGEYVATMTEPASATLTANTPYLYMPNKDGEVDFSGAYTIPSTLTAGETTNNGWTFKGTYTGEQWESAPTGIYGFSAQTQDGISQGQFVKVGTNVSINPMRCYLQYGDGSTDYAGARGTSRAEQLPEIIKVRLVSASGEVTAIGSLQTKTGEVTLDGDAWYTLDGRRMEGKPATKGIYINNNSKVIIK